MRSRLRPSARTIVALALVLAGAVVAVLLLSDRNVAIAVPFEPNYVQNGGREALRDYAALAEFIGQRNIKDRCKPGFPDSMQMALSPAFDPPVYITLIGRDLKRTRYRRGAGRPGDRSGLQVDTIALANPSDRSRSELWQKVDASFLQMPPVNDAFLPLDGYSIYLEICKSGRYAFYSRFTPENSEKDQRLVVVKDALWELSRLAK